MTTLSPAAQAVLDAYWKDEWGSKQGAIAAVLREVINQCQNGQGVISAADLCLIADELEAQP